MDQQLKTREITGSTTIDPNAYAESTIVSEILVGLRDMKPGTTARQFYDTLDTSFTDSIKSLHGGEALTSMSVLRELETRYLIENSRRDASHDRSTTEPSWRLTATGAVWAFLYAAGEAGETATSKGWSNAVTLDALLSSSALVDYSAIELHSALITLQRDRLLTIEGMGYSLTRSPIFEIMSR